MNIESACDQRFFRAGAGARAPRPGPPGAGLTIELRNWGLLPDTLEAFRSVGMPIVVSTKYFAEHQGMPTSRRCSVAATAMTAFCAKTSPTPSSGSVEPRHAPPVRLGRPGYARRLVESCHLGDGSALVTPPARKKGSASGERSIPVSGGPTRRGAPPRVGGSRSEGPSLGFPALLVFSRGVRRMAYDRRHRTRFSCTNWRGARRPRPRLCCWPPTGPPARLFLT